MANTSEKQINVNPLIVMEAYSLSLSQAKAKGLPARIYNYCDASKNVLLDAIKTNNVPYDDFQQALRIISDLSKEVIAEGISELEAEKAVSRYLDDKLPLSIKPCMIPEFFTKGKITDEKKALEAAISEYGERELESSYTKTKSQRIKRGLLVGLPYIVAFGALIGMSFIGKSQAPKSIDAKLETKVDVQYNGNHIAGGSIIPGTGVSVDYQSKVSSDYVLIALKELPKVEVPVKRGATLEGDKPKAKPKPKPVIEKKPEPKVEQPAPQPQQEEEEESGPKRGATL